MFKNIFSRNKFVHQQKCLFVFQRSAVTGKFWVIWSTLNFVFIRKKLCSSSSRTVWSSHSETSRCPCRFETSLSKFYWHLSYVWLFLRFKSSLSASSFEYKQIALVFLHYFCCWLQSNVNHICFVFSKPMSWCWTRLARWKSFWRFRCWLGSDTK